MRKIFVFLLVLIAMGGVFAETATKHLNGDILLGFDIGAGLTTNILGNMSAMTSLEKGNYALVFGGGLNLDYYLGSVLSVSSGVRFHSGIYAFLDKNLIFNEDTNFSDIAKTPMCITVPVMAHINFPFFQWLYAGAGVTLNFPFKSLLDNQIPPEVEAQLGKIDTKGTFFIGVPIDLGFDFITAGHGGMRLFFRILPEFHGSHTVMPIGIIWQIANIKLK
jgi:hypothetical protein